MSSIVHLVQNENMKIYRRPATWVMTSILITLIIIMGLVTKFLINDTVDENWKEALATENESLEEIVSDPHLMGALKKQYENEIATNQYRIENDIKPIATASFWGFVKSAVDLTSMITMFTIIIAAGIVANEFSWGTIKLLLARPVTRGKILLSKYVSTFGFALFSLIVLFIVSMIVSGILFGFSAITQPHLVYIDGVVEEKNMILHLLFLYGLRGVDLLMMVTFAFMISTVFRSSSLAIGLALFLMFTGSQVVMLLSQYDWVKYILFANTYLGQHIEGTPIVEGMTMTFSLIVLAVYFTIFNLLSWYVFKKRDIAA